MTDFKAKMHQIRFRLASQTPLGELTALPRPPSWIWGRFAAGEGLGWGRGGKGGWEGEGGGSGGEGKGGPPSYC